MTNFRKVLGTCLAVFVLMGAQSCNREVAEPSAAEGKTHAEETIYKEGNVEMPVSENLVFDAAGENQLKALNATVNASASAGANSRHTVTYEQKIPVVCIVRSDQNDPITYVDNVEIIRQSNGTYKFAKDRIHLAQGSTLAPGKKWYLMVVTQNSFNKSTGELSVNATGAPETLSPSATRVMDIPSASPWIELPMFPNGQPKWSKDWDAARRAKKLTLYPQGVLCRATLRLDDAYKAKLGGNNVDLKITQLKVVSTALSFSGKFKFDKASLPPLTQTSGSPTLTWEPTPEASTSKEYRSLDANTPEYQKVFNASNGGSVLQVSGNGSSAMIFADSNNPTRVDKTNLPEGVQSIIFWAVPVKDVTNRHTTLIAETGLSSSAKVLAPSHTYIYGKKHTKDAAQGSAVYFDAVYYNPYTPLDYMAEYNVKRKWPDQFRPGGWIPHDPSNEFDTEHGVNSFTFLTKEEVNQVSLSSGGRTYKSPTHAQWSSVIPYEGKAAINTTGGSAVDGANVYAEVGQLKGWTKFSSRVVVGKGKNTRYALALTDLGGSQKYRTAYRYRMEYGKGDLQIWAPYILKNTSRPNFLEDPRYSRLDNYVLTIQAVQLGAGFVGTVEDIANEDFWNNTANQRKEERILPRNFTVYSVSSPLYNAPFNAWGDAPTVYYLGDNLLAAFNANFGTWGVVDMNSRGAYNLIHFPVRPFTKQER